jgi:antitoxin ParD1/3/4
MTPAGRMTLMLGAELEQFVEEEARKRDYASTSEYVRDLVRERFLQEQDRAEKWAALDAALDDGIADIEAGRYMELDDAFRLIKEELAKA